jgi:hypothetical protein
MRPADRLRDQIVPARHGNDGSGRAHNKTAVPVISAANYRVGKSHHRVGHERRHDLEIFDR